MRDFAAVIVGYRSTGGAPERRILGEVAEVDIGGEFRGEDFVLLGHGAYHRIRRGCNVDRHPGGISRSTVQPVIVPRKTRLVEEIHSGVVVQEASVAGSSDCSQPQESEQFERAQSHAEELREDACSPPQRVSTP